MKLVVLAIMIVLLFVGVTLSIASWSIESRKEAKRDAFRAGTMNCLEYFEYVINTRDTTKNHPAYYTDAEIDSVLAGK